MKSGIWTAESEGQNWQSAFFAAGMASDQDLAGVIATLVRSPKVGLHDAKHLPSLEYIVAVLVAAALCSSNTASDDAKLLVDALSDRLSRADGEHTREWLHPAFLARWGAVLVPRVGCDAVARIVGVVHKRFAYGINGVAIELARAGHVKLAHDYARLHHANDADDFAVALAAIARSVFTKEPSAGRSVFQAALREAHGGGTRWGDEGVFETVLAELEWCGIPLDDELARDAVERSKRASDARAEVERLMWKPFLDRFNGEGERASGEHNMVSADIRWPDEREDANASATTGRMRPRSWTLSERICPTQRALEASIQRRLGVPMNDAEAARFFVELVLLEAQSKESHGVSPETFLAYAAWLPNLPSAHQSPVVLMLERIGRSIARTEDRLRCLLALAGFTPGRLFGCLPSSLLQAATDEARSYDRAVEDLELLCFAAGQIAATDDATGAALFALGLERTTEFSSASDIEMLVDSVDVACRHEGRALEEVARTLTVHFGDKLRRSPLQRGRLLSKSKRDALSEITGDNLRKALGKPVSGMERDAGRFAAGVLSWLPPSHRARFVDEVESVLATAFGEATWRAQFWQALLEECGDTLLPALVAIRPRTDVLGAARVRAAVRAGELRRAFVLLELVPPRDRLSLIKSLACTASDAGAEDLVRECSDRCSAQLASHANDHDKGRQLGARALCALLRRDLPECIIQLEQFHALDRHTRPRIRLMNASVERSLFKTFAWPPFETVERLARLAPELACSLFAACVTQASPENRFEDLGRALEVVREVASGEGERIEAVCQVLHAQIHWLDPSLASPLFDDVVATIERRPSAIGPHAVRLFRHQRHIFGGERRWQQALFAFLENGTGAAKRDTLQTLMDSLAREGDKTIPCWLHDGSLAHGVARHVVRAWGRALLAVGEDATEQLRELLSAPRLDLGTVMDVGRLLQVANSLHGRHEHVRALNAAIPPTGATRSLVSLHLEQVEAVRRAERTR